MKNLMDVADLQASPNARAQAIAAATLSFQKHKHLCPRNDLMVVINMREPSHRKRLHIVDLTYSNAVLDYHTSHGTKSSDPNNRAMAIKFSNVKGSHQTSLGPMRTTDTYNGKHGYSLKLQGLDKNLNSNVEARYIVIHTAQYMTQDFIRTNFRAGQSHGCFVLNPDVYKYVIDLIKGGVFLYCHY